MNENTYVSREAEDQDEVHTEEVHWSPTGRSCPENRKQNVTVKLSCSSRIPDSQWLNAISLGNAVHHSNVNSCQTEFFIMFDVGS